tara:strand:- start:1242 stop:1463 length:222 start_codon:yes stop_codon:yes gene_type:complete
MLDKQIKEKRRIVNEIARIKQAILDVRVDANVLVAELKVNETDAVEMANLMSNAYDLLEQGLKMFYNIMNDRL